MKPEHRLSQIDALRGISILLVLLNHSDSYTPWNIRSYDFVHAFTGSVGVVLFFVISGYAITLSLYRHQEKKPTGTSPIKAFMWRRFWRLQPLALFWVTFTIIGTAFLNFTGFFGDLAQNSRAALSVLTLTANYQALLSGGLGALSVYWSLSIEEQFYLVYPFVFFAVRSRKQLLSISIVGYIILAIFVRNPLIVDYFGVHSWVGIFFLAPFYQPILAGIIVYILTEIIKSRNTEKEISAFRWVGVAAAIMLPCTYILTKQYYYPIVVYVPLFCAVIVFAAALPGKTFPGTKAMSWVGHRSYGLYLAHMPCSMVVREAAYALFPTATSPGWAVVAVTIIAWAMMTFGVTELLYQFVEKPLTEYGRRFTDRKVESPAYR
ncbi:MULTISPECIES: acyltransferase [unclassified Pseudomonas]|uniref:acyltransferase family protein n=1 Tax=unclassified Pseudomonas TaxID=196821 RepID=UPI001F592B2D|nr:MULTISPECIES: acyltransferase [unclassified Pseudomonas]